MDTGEDAREKRNRRRGLESLGKYFAGAVMDRVLSGAFNPIIAAAVGVVVSVLVLLKTGILQIANWPSSAFVVLGIAAFILLGVAVALTLVWGLVKGARLALNLLLGVLKIPLLERTRFERITDPVILVLLFPVVTVFGWISDLIGWIDEQRNKPTSPADGTPT
jgi:hypothetical protein